MNTPRLHTIGQGACGTVWAASENGPVYKREDGGPGRSLKNDFEMHCRIIQSFLLFKETHPNNLPIKVSIPHRFIKATDQGWWSTNQQKFPPGHTPCNMIHSQRIPPFSQNIRQVLIDNYCPPKIVSKIITSQPDKDCLIRPYLGRRRTKRHTTTSRFTAFSLRNFPLHLDQLESLGISTVGINKYAQTMAETLAVMHWIAEIDGNDIEFVLAPHSPSEGQTGAFDDEADSHPLGKHSMWVLDFDLCRNITMDAKGVEQCVAAFWGNDPYYPRPERDRELWRVFREYYLRISDTCSAGLEAQEREKRRVLAWNFIGLLEQDGERTEKNK